MSKSFERYQKRRLTASYFSVVLIVTLVLLLVGYLGLTVLKFKNVADHFKEKVTITLFLKDYVENEEALELFQTIRKEKYSKNVRYITKEDAAKEYGEDLGEDFMSFLGDNPLKDSFVIELKAKYVTSARMLLIKKELEKSTLIHEVSYDAPLVDVLMKNLKTIGFWLIVAASFLGFVAMLLINSSIRLSIYNRRFTIKTMQMVGATKSFIRRPFIWRSIVLGIVSAFIASVGVFAGCYYLNMQFPALKLLEDKEVLGLVFIGLFAVAILITLISSFFATQRFLRLKTEKLYS